MPLSDADCAATYKILVLGDASVGKTALLRCLVGQEFREKLYPTIATDFVRRRVEVDGALIELQIWDSAGQERFRSVTRWQYRGVKGVVMVYDVTDRATFTHLPYWLESINQDISFTHNKYESVPIVLLGNKVDLEQDRQVQRREGLKLAEKELALEFFETSAKTGQHVFDAFRKLAYHVTDICNPDVMKSYHKNMIRQPDHYILDSDPTTGPKHSDITTGPKPKSTSSKTEAEWSTSSKTEAEWTKTLPHFSTKTLKLKKRKSKRSRKCCLIS